MSLEDAVHRNNLSGVKKALAAGERPDFDLLTNAVDRDSKLLEALVLAAKPAVLKQGGPEDNLLMMVGMHIRSNYPNGIRNRRANDSSVKEPARILALRANAAILREAGVPVTFGAAAMLNYTEEVAAMLAKDAKLATKKVWDQSIAELAAWAGAWEACALIKEARSGKRFDWDALPAAIATWAKKALAAFAKRQRGKTFRRVALDFDAPNLLVAADAAGGTATRPGGYSHGEIASFDEHALAGAVEAQVGRPGGDAKFLAAVTRAAALLAKHPGLPVTEDFAVIAFDHDEDEASARRRSAPAKAKPAVSAKSSTPNKPAKATRVAKPAKRPRSKR